LPPHLIASFHATLEEVRTADLLLHVVDVSHPAMDEHIKVVEETLQEIGAGDKPTILVLNKADKLPPDWDKEALLRRYPNAVLVSALTGEGLNTLLSRIQDEFRRVRVVAVHARLALWAQNLIAFVYRNGVVREIVYDTDWVSLDAEMERPFAESLQKQAEEMMAGEVVLKEAVPAGSQR